uniref:CBM-cenC domain-containing protein n=1 Tax=Eiseniibacteriota bacterium TaxID=2212470 RepID=A0A832MKE0_UNCEI
MPRLVTSLVPAVALLALLAAPPAVRAQAYPRLGLYGSMFDSGYPLWDANGWTPVFDIVARYDQVILDASPITPYRPDAAAALRARNPDIQLLAYVLGQDMWQPSGADPATHFPTKYWNLLVSLDGLLYNRQGTYYSAGRINLAKRVGGRYVVAEAIADFFHRELVQPGVWDGIFMDVFCPYIVWTQTPAESIDIVRAGYATMPEFDAAWHAATDTLGDRLRRLAGPDFVLVGNCAQGVNYDAFNGWMRENFPQQNGGDWYSNMFRSPGGYLAGDTNFVRPLHNYISSLPAGTAGQQYSAENARRVRFGLASASLGEGYGVFNIGNRNSNDSPYMSWWYDEYAVDLASGASSSSIAHTGWLGAALGPYHQMIWVGTAPDAVTHPGFETDVTSGWSFGSSVGATRAHDLTTAAVGGASLRVTLPVAGAVPWAATLKSLSTLPMSAGQIYSATFWAKASQPRSIDVAAALAEGALHVVKVAIGTEWRQYQVALRPGASGEASLGFYLAEAAGEVWLDDCHLQAGATTLYRRDFQNGIVLVNPSGSALTAPLGRPFRKIAGTVDPVTNDGSTVTSVTVPARDAVFLIGTDVVPPDAVRDLRVVSPAPAGASRPRRTTESPPTP